MKILLKSICHSFIMCSVAFMLFAGCSKTDSVTSTDTYASKIAGVHLWKGGMATTHGSCAIDTIICNDTTFALTYVNDSTLNTWEGVLKYYNHIYVSTQPIVTIKLQYDTIVFSHRSAGLGCWKETNYWSKL